MSVCTCKDCRQIVLDLRALADTVDMDTPVTIPRAVLEYLLLCTEEKLAEQRVLN